MDDQYRIIENRAGFADCTGFVGASGLEAAVARGRVRVDGPDAASFLQALVSNDLASLGPGRGVYATYLTPQGRMLADIEIYRRPGALICSTAASVTAGLAARLDGLIFAEDVGVSDISADWSEVVVAGGAAAELLAEVLGESSEALRELPELGHLDVGDGFVSRAGISVLPSYKLFVPVPKLGELTGALERAGLPSLRPELLEGLRIERGRGRWGAEFTEDIIPLEAGLLDRAISTSKGCYVGQEIIIRILHRGSGRVARRLVTLDLDVASGEPPAAGSSLHGPEGAAVGKLTSVSRALAGGRWIALGYVSRDHAETGRQLQVRDTSVVATVTGLAA